MPKTPTECFSCGARLPPSKGGTVTCKYCNTEVEAREATNVGDLFPNFRKKPIPCPDCGKKAIRPRIRTRDFRCQACSAVFPGGEIEEQIGRLLREEKAGQYVAQVIKNVLVRNVPEPYRHGDIAWDDWIEKRIKEQSTNAASSFAFVGLLATAGVGIGIFLILDWATWVKVVVTIVALALLGGGGSAIDSSIAEAKIRREAKEGRSLWENENRQLVPLLENFLGVFYEELTEYAESREEDDERADEEGDEDESEEVAQARRQSDEMGRAAERMILAGKVEMLVLRLKHPTLWLKDIDKIEPAIAQYGTGDEKKALAFAVRELRELSGASAEAS